MAAADAAAIPLRPLQLAAIVLSAGCAAFVVVFAAILPAEFGRDPFGWGAATHIGRLWAPREISLKAPAAPDLAPAWTASAPFRSDAIEIPLGTAEKPGKGFELEYKVRLRKGAVLIYAWEVIGPTQPNDFYFDFHGHTLPTDGSDKITVAHYGEGSARGGQGSLTAPMDGIHGWFFQNSAVNAVKVRLHLSGFYELVPAGQPGNEAGW